MVNLCPVCRSHRIIRKIQHNQRVEMDGKWETTMHWTYGEKLYPQNKDEFIVAEWCNDCKVMFSTENV